MQTYSTTTKNAQSFAELAQSYPALKQFLTKKNQIEFQDPRAARALAQATLCHEYKLLVEWPLDSLTPGIASRANYLSFIRDLLQLNDIVNGRRHDEEVVGVDIGCGCSCVYPLLACSLNPHWNMVAYDIDDRSVSYAQQNVTRNKLNERIHLHHNTSTHILPKEILRHYPKIAFTMTNPPFYASHEEIQQLTQKKSTPAYGTCTGSNGEMITTGGEVTFLQQYIRESLSYRDQVGWFTSLIGIKSHLDKVLKDIVDAGATYTKTAELVQGKTKRWVVAWTFR